MQLAGRVVGFKVAQADEAALARVEGEREGGVVVNGDGVEERRVGDGFAREMRGENNLVHAAGVGDILGGGDGGFG